jgi:hypothetical protein
MKRTTRICQVGLIFALASAALTPSVIAAEFTSDFSIERCKFEPNGRQNPYFSLNPGDQVTLEGEDEGAALKVEITVDDATKPFTFQTPKGAKITLVARVIVEKEWVDGELVEVSHNWFSRCRQTNDVFYFGEAVDLYENGQVVGHGGSWETGKNGAQPGILIPARFLLGSRYFQEQAAGVALDRSEHVGAGISMKLAGKTLRDCVAVAETTPLEPGHVSDKVYCPGVGLVLDNEAVLTGYKRD